MGILLSSTSKFFLFFVPTDKKLKRIPWSKSTNPIVQLDCVIDDFDIQFVCLYVNNRVLGWRGSNYTKGEDRRLYRTIDFTEARIYTISNFGFLVMMKYQSESKQTRFLVIDAYNLKTFGEFVMDWSPYFDNMYRVFSNHDQYNPSILPNNTIVNALTKDYDKTLVLLSTDFSLMIPKSM